MAESETKELRRDVGRPTDIVEVRYVHGSSAKPPVFLQTTATPAR
jgi:hypothetical protein